MRQARDGAARAARPVWRWRSDPVRLAAVPRARRWSRPAVLAALAVVAAITGIQLSHLYSTRGRALPHRLRPRHQPVPVARHVHGPHASTSWRGPFRRCSGIFWGAPLLARELETGTYRLAWTQSVTRSRWLITKLGTGRTRHRDRRRAAHPHHHLVVPRHDNVGTDPYARVRPAGHRPDRLRRLRVRLGALLGAVIGRTVPAMAATLGVLRLRPHRHHGLGPAAPASAGSQDACRCWARARRRRCSSAWGPSNGGALTLFAHGRRPGQILDAVQPSPDQFRAAGELGADVSAFLHQYCPNVGPPPAAPPGHGDRRTGRRPRARAGRASTRWRRPSTSSSPTSRPTGTGRSSGSRPASSSLSRSPRRSAATSGSPAAPTDPSDDIRGSATQSSMSCMLTR